MQNVLVSKYFWLAVALAVPFLVIWAKASLLHAVIAYAVFGGMTAMFIGRMRAKKGEGREPDFIMEHRYPDSSPVADRPKKRPRKAGLKIHPITGRRMKGPRF